MGALYTRILMDTWYLWYTTTDLYGQPAPMILDIKHVWGAALTKH